MLSAVNRSSLILGSLFLWCLKHSPARSSLHSCCNCFALKFLICTGKLTESNSGVGGPWCFQFASSSVDILSHPPAGSFDSSAAAPVVIFRAPEERRATWARFPGAQGAVEKRQWPAQYDRETDRCWHVRQLLFRACRRELISSVSAWSPPT